MGGRPSGSWKTPPYAPEKILRLSLALGGDTGDEGWVPEI